MRSLRSPAGTPPPRVNRGGVASCDAGGWAGGWGVWIGMGGRLASVRSRQSGKRTWGVARCRGAGGAATTHREQRIKRLRAAADHALEGDRVVLAVELAHADLRGGHGVWIGSDGGGGGGGGGGDVCVCGRGCGEGEGESSYTVVVHFARPGVGGKPSSPAAVCARTFWPLRTPHIWSIVSSPRTHICRRTSVSESPDGCPTPPL